MILRRYFCLCLCALLAAIPGWSASDQPSLEFIQLTDTHLANLAGAEARVASAREHFAPSAKSLAAFFAGPGLKYRPSFYLITGDLTDAFRYEGAGRDPVYGQVENFTRAVAGSAAPVYLALGNHDIQHYAVNPATGNLQADQSVAGEARAAWIASAKCFAKGTYYSFEKSVGRSTYLFLVLDNAYNAGAIAQEQLHWLRRQVERQGSHILVLAMHIPLGGDKNSAAIKGALGDARVALVLAGHNHSDAVEEIAIGGPVVQVRTAAFGYGENNWRRIRLREDAIDVFATGAPEHLEKTIVAPVPAAAAR